MGIKKTSRPDLLQETQKLFAEYGYAGTSFAKIAKSLLLNKASIFYYIKSKEDLAVQVVQAFHNRCVDAIIHVLRQNNLSLQAKQVAFSEAVATFLLKEPNAVFITLLNLEGEASEKQRIKDILQMHVNYWRSAFVLIFNQQNKETIWDNPALLDIQRTMALHKFLPHVCFDFI